MLFSRAAKKMNGHVGKIFSDEMKPRCFGFRRKLDSRDTVPDLLAYGKISIDFKTVNDFFVGICVDRIFSILD